MVSIAFRPDVFKPNKLGISLGTLRWTVIVLVVRGFYTSSSYYLFLLRDTRFDPRYLILTISLRILFRLGSNQVVRLVLCSGIMS